MSPGLLVAWIVTLFGMIAGAAIVGAQFRTELLPQVMALWLVFLFCIGAGVTAGLMFAPRSEAAPLMMGTGYFLILLGLTAGALALASLLNLVSVGFGLPLWLLFAGCLPVGILLAHSGHAMAPVAQRE